MSFQLYLRPHPRTFYLFSSTHALLFKQPEQDDQERDGNAAGKDGNSAIVELLSLDEVDERGLIKVNAGRSTGELLGLLSLPIDSNGSSEIFLVLISSSLTLPAIIPQTHLTPSKVLSVEFHCLTSSLWDDPSQIPLAPVPGEEAFEDDGYYQSAFSSPGSRANGNTHGNNSNSNHNGTPGRDPYVQPTVIPLNPAEGIKKILSTGTFYFATNGDWDLSRSLRGWDWKRIKREGEGEKGSGCLDDMDERFVWNQNILQPLLHFRQSLLPAQRTHLDGQNFFVPLIQGFAGTVALSPTRLPGNQQQQTSLALISRLGWKRAGARFRTRGVDDDGNVANFVETETVLAMDDVVMSFLQVRGSVPLFWEQVGNQTFGQKLQITRPQAASQPAFDKHFLDLIDHYGSVHCINLLGQGENEMILSDIYNAHVSSLSTTLRSSDRTINRMTGEEETLVSLTPYDFHAAVRVSGHDVVKEDFGKRITSVRDAREKYGWNVIDRGSGDVVMRQSGVFRVNCLDCLDRTNYVEDVFSLLTISSFLASLGHTSTSAYSASATILSAHRGLWADNGDALSKIYAGTGALNTSVTRSGKRTFASLISDASKSVGRAIQATFNDTDKQASIELFLGIMAGQKPVRVYDPISDSIQAALTSRLLEYSSPKKVSIFTGTWNLCGRALSGDLEDWLFPEGEKSYDLYSIAFQELVPLNAQQILQTDPAARRKCEAVLAAVFEQNAGKDAYVLLRSEQLVGTAIFVYVKAGLLPSITRVEGASRKTGLRGMSGNKGGCGIRLDLHDTPICLMTCHLAAGHTNVAERNADYYTIANGLAFQRGRTIADHDVIIWAADCNYRLNLTNEEVRAAITEGDVQQLWEADQLRSAMVHRDAFGSYNESQIAFAPTYKYDVGTDDYDTSEKQRIPAWTDRILFQGKLLKSKSYATADIKTSDHRPVYATFKLTVHIVDQSKKQKVMDELNTKLEGRMPTTRPSSNIKPPPSVKRAPPGAPDRSKKTPTESNLISFDSAPSPTKAAPPPRPPKPSTLQSQQRIPSSSSVATTSTEDDYVRVASLTSAKPNPPLQRLPAPASAGAMLPPPRRQTNSTATGTSTPAYPAGPAFPRFPSGPATRQSSVSSLASNFSTLSDKMAKTNIGSQASGLLNAARSAATNGSAAPKFVPNLPSPASDSRRVPPALPGRPSATHDLDLSIPPHLRSALQGLLQCEDLPEKTRETIQSSLQGPDGYVLGEESKRDHINDNDKDDHNDDTNDITPIDEEDYISRQALADIAKWARSDQGSASLARCSLDPYDYHLISLLSGTKTRTSRAQERLIAANPDLDHNFLPSHLLEAKNKTKLSIGQEYQSIRKELAAAANVLFSVGGVGGAVFVVAKSSAGLRPEKAILLAFLAALVVAFAEIWLYVSQAKRVERERAREAVERLGEGDKAELKVSVAEADEDAIVEALNAAGNDREGQEPFIEGTVLEQTEDTKQTSREVSNVRLRRRPVAGQEE